MFTSIVQMVVVVGGAQLACSPSVRAVWGSKVFVHVCKVLVLLKV